MIAIISLLSSVVLASLSSARENARDAKRIQVVNQIQTALEMYYNDKGEYPPRQHIYTAESGEPDDCGHNGGWCWLENELSPYIGPLPKNDPEDDTYYYMYYASAGDSYQKYGLGVRLENEDNKVGLNDGGFYPSSDNTDAEFNAYEVGPVVSYCLNKYNGNASDWFWKAPDWTEVCEGGN